MANPYGIDTNSLQDLIFTPQATDMNWGSLLDVVSRNEYALQRLAIKARQSFEFAISDNFEATFFVEAGDVKIDDISLTAQELITYPPKAKINISSSTDSILYVFQGPMSEEAKHLEKTKPFDYREKYWGSIQTIVSTPSYAAKRIFKKKGGSASLEFHRNKLESYYIHSGKLLLRLRAGRGEDRFFELVAGQSNLLLPGLMHQRGGMEDSVIFEISTKDEDRDSYLVEDGQTHPMPRLAALTDMRIKFEVQKITFDIDGIIRTQTKGDYENARPIPGAIALINKLYDEGYRITLYTSSFMGRNKGNQHMAYQDGYLFNKKQLAEWGIKYHELYMGKPSGHVLIDDRAVFFQPDWDLIEKEIRDKLKGAI